MTQPEIGSMQLFDGVRPAITSGLHSITSKVVVDTAVATPGLNEALHRDFMQVGGSALHLGPNEVIACHPPRNGTGAYSSELPHVVLRRRTLPWERTGPGGGPWLALLLFANSEVGFATLPLPVVVGGAAAAAFDAEETGASGRSVDGVLVHDPNVLQGVLPTPSELAALTHVRRVNTTDTTLDMDDDDGWLAVVVANRLPLAPQVPAHYHACLVSLEHREDLYSGPQTASMLLLYRWDFIVDSDGTFAALSEHLDTAALGETSSAVTDVHGRSTLVHVERDGTTVSSTYRGPFTLEEIPLPEGEEDVSYDAAYELGRLMGAADGPFMREIVEWHRRAASQAHASIQQSALRAVQATNSDPGLGLSAQPQHVAAAATGLDIVLRNLAPRATHRPRRNIGQEDPHG